MKTKRNFSHSCLLGALLFALPTVLQAQFIFTTNNSAITITGYTGSGGAVVIPETINGYPVTTIGGSAFYNKSSLTTILIGTNVTSIGGSAFGGCYNLTNVTIGSSVTNIGTFCFANDTRLIAITVDTNNPAFSSAAGVLFDKNQNTLLVCPAGKSGDYSISNSVTTITNFAFNDCTNLTSVMIPNSVTSIGGFAFASCNKLTGVRIPRSVTNIGPGPFSGCKKLNSITVDSLNTFFTNSVDGVLFNQNQTMLIQYPAGKTGSYTIPDSVTSIGQNAFASCLNLTRVILGNSVNIVGYYAFNNCLNLTSVTIPDSVTRIYDSAFSSCAKLANIALPKSVTYIGTAVFDSCPSMSSITVDILNPYYSSADGVLFNKIQTTLIKFPTGKSGSYTLPNTVTNIQVLAFYECLGLTSITIPSSVTSIGSSAFANCYNLARIYFLGNAPSLGSSVFAGGSVYYMPGTTGWGTTFGRRPTALWNPQSQTSDGGFGVRSNRFGFQITGSSNMVIVVEACATLVNPVWSPIQTNTLTNGVSYFTDTEWTNFPGRFYRLRSP